MPPKLPRSKKGRFVSIKQHEKVEKFIISNVNVSDGNNNTSECHDAYDTTEGEGDRDPGDYTYSVCTNVQPPSPDHDSNSSDSDSDIEYDDGIITWKDGRRVVELDVVCTNLQKGCSMCTEELSLVNICSERRYGLGSLLYIKCSKGHVTTVPTGKRHTDPESTSSKSRELVWDINTKLGFGVNRGFRRNFIRKPIKLFLE